MTELPTCLARELAGDEARLSLRIDATLAAFRGHFPGRPVLPGVAQLAWVAHYAQELYGFPPRVAALEQIKFKRPVAPDQVLSLHLSRRADGKGVRFEFRDPDTSYSSGILKFG